MQTAVHLLLPGSFFGDLFLVCALPSMTLKLLIMGMYFHDPTHAFPPRG